MIVLYKYDAESHTVMVASFEDGRRRPRQACAEWLRRASAVRSLLWDDHDRGSDERDAVRSDNCPTNPVKDDAVLMRYPATGLTSPESATASARFTEGW
jgi:hypothetical protein